MAAPQISEETKITLDLKTIGIIKNEAIFSEKKLDNFKDYYKKLRDHGKWSKEDIISEYKKLLPEFNHKETGKYLDQKM